MIVPGIIISVLTFPGVIVHELAHAIFCKLLRIPIYEIKYFQFANPTGYVVHEPTDNPMKTLLISVGPFIINTILGIFITMPISFSIFIFKGGNSLLDYFLAWLGISILMHSFPSTGDAQVLVDNVLKNKEVSIFLKIAICPIVGLIYIGAIGSVVWLDFLYALGVASVLNIAILSFFR